ncbi:hypothetical protein [Devosia aquimaris]|uniref:hypothetical protein n=1 Tax=Devosia aquimaris TaxID=2866214 RepID=UPI001CD15C8D|nr:hypothetical protein [Devosia sp. CJK-A8-3]
MKSLSILSRAATGWRLIVQGHPGWRSQFALTTPGLVTALLLYAFVAFLAVALTSMSIGMPGIGGVIAAMAVLALPILAFVLVLLGTRKMLNDTQPLLPALVPGVYALTALLLAEGLLALFAGPLVMLAWVGVAYLLYCLMRVAMGWHAAISAGSAVLTFVLLVALRMALYMVSNFAASLV